MHDLIIPQADVVVRRATPADLADVDALQKAHSRELGFLHRATLEGKVKLGQMLVAHDARGAFAGYVVGSDTYHKREEVGVVYQMAVAPPLRRTTVAATLLRGLFASWPYGTRLCCAWCAQDLPANRFWEAMGFVPLAYRAGSAGKGRVHIFWQKRIVEGDVETRWWYPSITGSGAIREDRLVLPIPEGQHWSETRPTVLPDIATSRDREGAVCAPVNEPGPLPDSRGSFGATDPGPLPHGRGSLAEGTGPLAHGRGSSGGLPEGVEERDGKFYLGRKRLMTAEMIREMLGIGRGSPFMVPMDVKLVKEMPVSPAVAKKKARAAKPKAKRKHDPRMASAVRELRDRWLEHVNTGGLLLPSAGKYAVGRPAALPEAGSEWMRLPMPTAMPTTAQRLLPAA